MKRILQGGPFDGRTYEDDLDDVEVTNVPAVGDDMFTAEWLETNWHRYVYHHTDNNVAVFRYDGETT